MSTHTPPIPPANRSTKGPKHDHPGDDNDTSKKPDKDPHAREQGDTANVKQNTTNPGAGAGRRI